MKLLWLLLILCSAAEAKTYTIYADCHYGVMTEVCPNLESLNAVMVERQNFYSLGDIVELKNAEPRNLPKMVALYNKHKVLMQGRFVSGNHDAAGYSNDYDLVIQHDAQTRVLFTHGDIPLWGQKKAFKFRTEKRGQGFGSVNKVGLNHRGHISNSEAEELAAYAGKFNADVIIIGHVHVATIFDEIVNGVRVISVPRGKTQVSIP